MALNTSHNSYPIIYILGFYTISTSSKQGNYSKNKKHTQDTTIHIPWYTLYQHNLVLHDKHGSLVLPTQNNEIDSIHLNILIKVFKKSPTGIWVATSMVFVFVTMFKVAKATFNSNFLQYQGSQPAWFTLIPNTLSTDEKLLPLVLCLLQNLSYVLQLNIIYHKRVSLLLYSFINLIESITNIDLKASTLLTWLECYTATGFMVGTNINSTSNSYTLVACYCKENHHRIRKVHSKVSNSSL